MNSSRMTYATRSDTTLQGELNALEAIYLCAIERCGEGKEGSCPTTSGPAEPTQGPERGDERKR